MESNNPNNHQEATRRPTITNNNAIRSEQIDRSNKSTPAEELYPHYTFLLGMASLVGDICDLYEPCDACHKMIYDRWFNKPKPE